MTRLSVKGCFGVLPAVTARMQSLLLAATSQDASEYPTERRQLSGEGVGYLAFSCAA